VPPHAELGGGGHGAAAAGARLRFRARTPSSSGCGDSATTDASSSSPACAGSPLTSLLALEPALEPRACFVAPRPSISIGCLTTPSGASDSAFEHTDMMSLHMHCPSPT
jgi:hypothetical protein